MGMPSDWDFLRVGTSAVFVNFDRGLVYKVLTESQSKNVADYIDWYFSLPLELAQHFPRPISLERLVGSYYLYLEQALPGRRYVPSLSTFFEISKRLLFLLRAISGPDGTGPQHNNMTYGNILYHRGDIFVIDWILFSKQGFPILDYLAFVDSIYWYLFGSTVNSKSIDFVKRALRLACTEYILHLGILEKDFLLKFLGVYVERVYPPHSTPAYRDVLQQIMENRL